MASLPAPLSTIDNLVVCPLSTALHSYFLHLGSLWSSSTGAVHPKQQFLLDLAGVMASQITEERISRSSSTRRRCYRLSQLIGSIAQNLALDNDDRGVDALLNVVNEVTHASRAATNTSDGDVDLFGPLLRSMKLLKEAEKRKVAVGEYVSLSSAEDYVMGASAELLVPNESECHICCEEYYQEEKDMDTLDLLNMMVPLETAPTISHKPFQHTCCGQSVGAECLIEFLKESPTCPQCRKLVCRNPPTHLAKRKEMFEALSIRDFMLTPPKEDCNLYVLPVAMSRDFERIINIMAKQIDKPNFVHCKETRALMLALDKYVAEFVGQMRSYRVFEGQLLYLSDFVYDSYEKEDVSSGYVWNDFSRMCCYFLLNWYALAQPLRSTQEWQLWESKFAHRAVDWPMTEVLPFLW
ncbi:hypothetical protein EJ08DRAFT_645248 [Tothia fuscella]|uniref:Uncharacterized protein n=1 Tax=Tothia fuscella TaxID=1048955 RepID=A0A9P4P425_9PEZI|nr:hypothetical protein EJ08DRAFT_645248 [Tothia fuscella]